MNEVNQQYQESKEQDIVCVLCHGLHGNNTLCQLSRND